MKRNEILKQVATAIIHVKKTEDPFYKKEIKEEQNLSNDLYLCSMDIADICVQLEESQLLRKLPGFYEIKFVTVKDMVDYLEKLS